MKKGSTRKHTKYQNQSLMTLTLANQAENTKKVIESDEYYVQAHPQSNHRLYLFKLPLATEISVLVSSITTRLSPFIVHAEEDQLGAKIILQGLHYPGWRAKIAKMLDYFLFCCSKGLKFGKLSEVYNVILITIKKQAIDNQCLITITNPYSQLMKTEMRESYFNLILDPIQQEVKNVLKKSESLDHQNLTRNPYLNYNSPMIVDMQIHKKVYDLFITPDNKEYGRYKNIFLHSLQKIDKQIEAYRSKTNSLNGSSKKAPNPSAIVETLIKQSQSLLMSLKNTYKQDDSHEFNYLHPLLATQTSETVTLYTIEQTLCLYKLNTLKDIYYASNQAKCQAFNKQVEFLNSHVTDERCFEYLTLKKKYRLPSQNKPYFSAVQRLKLIQHSLSMREALLVIQQTFSDVKTDCFVSHKGKVQLTSMDELLPVIIFITIKAAIKDFPIYVMIIEDYIRNRSVFELEERNMTAFYAAIEDISQGWQITQQKAK